MASANDSSKRRRLLGDASPDASSCLSDLPSGILTNVANYLAPPSRALFAAALTTENAAASDERNTAIVGNEWTTLDFGDIEKDLAVKLSDGDISAVLLSIDAANRVKKLKLTNCINITGAGLEPLRGSTTIEQIDLSLVGSHQSPRLRPHPPVSREFVLPILDSIIEAEGCSLRHVQFPSAWSEWGMVVYEQTLRRYNGILVNRGDSCVNCNAHLPPGDRRWIDIYDYEQKYTCYECLKCYCGFCMNNDDKFMRLDYCVNCKKMYCEDCVDLRWCCCCQNKFCVSCSPFTTCSGSGCNADICEECIASGYAHAKCCKCEARFCYAICEDEISAYCISCEKVCCNACHEEDWNLCKKDDCQKSFCDDCNEKKGIKDAIQICDGCNMSYCGDCRVYMCQEDEGNNNCARCVQLAGPLLLEENKTLRNEVSRLRLKTKS